MHGYPRVWSRDGYHIDLPWVSEADAKAFEERHRAVYCRVEWMASPHGRLDHLLPQNLERQVRRQNIRSWIERARKRKQS